MAKFPMQTAPMADVTDGEDAASMLPLMPPKKKAKMPAKKKRAKSAKNSKASRFAKVFG